MFAMFLVINSSSKQNDCEAAAIRSKLRGVYPTNMHSPYKYKLMRLPESRKANENMMWDNVRHG